MAKDHDKFDEGRAPEYLYRYRSFHKDDNRNEEEIKTIFTRNELYFPSRIFFNDPFDCTIRFKFEGTKEQKIERGVELLEKGNTGTRKGRKNFAKKIAKIPEMLTNKLEQIYENTYSCVGVLSFAEEPNNLLMWSHYSSTHHGFCLKFKTSILSEEPQTVGGFILYPSRVQYSEEMPVINTIKPLKPENKENVDKIFLSKSRHWDYEKEWRINIPEFAGKTWKFPPEFLAGVIFGLRMPERNRNRLRQWIKEGDCKPKFYEARKKKNKYGLSIVPIS